VKTVLPTIVFAGGSILLDATLKITPVEQTASTGTIGYNPNIHYLRGLAALSVAFFHAALFHASEYGVSIMPMHALELFGIYGVAVFFAISGNLMSTLVQTQGPVEFLVRRCLRIYPLFILATVAIMVAHPKIWGEYNLASMSLAPVGETKYPLGKVEWTLVYEVFFYVGLFAVSVVGLRRHVALIAGVWAISIILAAMLGIQTLGFPTIANLPLQVVCIGLAGGLLIHHIKRVGTNSAFAIAGLALVLAYFAPTLAYEQLAAGISAVFLVAAVIRIPDFMPTIVRPVFKKLGDWSYGLYLIHIPVLFVLYQPAFKELGPSFLVIRIAAAVAGGAVLGQIDMVIHNWSRRVATHAKGLPTLFAITAYLAAYFAIALAYA